MAVITNTEHFAKLIAKELADYTEEVEEIIARTITTISKEALEAVRSKAKALDLKDSGEYLRGFKLRNEYKGKGPNKGWYRIYVTNSKWQIGHLLEYGHVKRNGGRTQSFPHWIEGQKVADTLPERIKEEIEGIKGGDT